MKLYYHKTDDCAEYYCLTHLDDSEEGDISSAVLRTDGDTFKAYTNKILQFYNTFSQRNYPHELEQPQATL